MRVMCPWSFVACFVLGFVVLARAADPVAEIEKAGITGGLVVQVGSDDLELKKLGERFHVRLLLAGESAVARAQAAIDTAGLQGRFTVSTWDGQNLPFADRVLNAVAIRDAGCEIRDEEVLRVLVPAGLVLAPADSDLVRALQSRIPHLASRISEGMAVLTKSWPDTIDDWTHYLYDASGNAVSKDKEVAPPRSLRWWAEPAHLRSHNHSASFTGLVAAGGRVFYMLDEGTFLFDSGQGGIEDHWALVARDAFNGAFLWERALKGYGQGFFEDVSGQAVPDLAWRTPLSLNRRLVAQGNRIFAALNYRNGPLSILDGGTGKTLHEVDVGGSVDEIVAEGALVVCRVRSEIPMPTLDRATRSALAREMKQKGASDEEVKSEPNRRIFQALQKQKLERVVAADAETGKILWQHDAPLVSVQTLAMAGGKVVFHNYESVVAIDAKNGQLAWTHPCPIVNARYSGIRNLLGNLLIADGKVLWTSTATGGGVCLDLADGRELWKNPRLGTTGGFAFPTALRVVNGVIYSDIPGATRFADGQPTPLPNIGDMEKRGHHIRCFAGKATERFLILPQRGAEFVDLTGDDNMANDWIRGACSYGLMPANGLTYVTPDPCTCYAGARINGFMALAATLPEGLAQAPAADAPSRIEKGPAFGNGPAPSDTPDLSDSSAWRCYRHDARRTGRASCALAAQLKPAWSRDLGGELTQATIAGGRAYIVRKDTCQLLCLDMADGKTVWSRSFPAALDGPPTIAGGRGQGAETRDLLYNGCRDGRVYCLRAADGALVWRFLAAPLDRLTLSDDRVESLWPVSSSVVFLNGVIYAVAGRNSYLDGGVRLYALDPATGTVKHHALLNGPWPDKATLRKAVVTERDVKNAEGSADSAQTAGVAKEMETQYATGYNMEGAEADLLVTDGADLYMMQSKFTRALDRVPLQRIFHTGLTPMGGEHLMANFGFLDDTMMHRSYMMYDASWPGYGGGSGWAARAGTIVVVGEKQAYAAKHYTGGWYPTHNPGDGDRLVADTFQHANTSGALADKAILKQFSQYGNAGEVVRTGAPAWETSVPIIVRAMLVAPDAKGNEMVFSAGIVEGKTKAEWDKSTRYEGPGKLLVHSGTNGQQVAECDLPACPINDGMSAAGGKIIIAMVNGEVIGLGRKTEP